MSSLLHRSVGLTAAVLTLAVTSGANAQNNRGSQIEQRLLNQVGNAINQQTGAGQYSTPGPYGGPNSASSPGNRGMYNNQPNWAPYGQPNYNPNAYPQTGSGNPAYNPNPYPQYGYGNQSYIQRRPQNFNQQPQQNGVVQNSGQRYQVPAQYAGYPAGSVVNYGGTSYVVSGDGTMSPSSGSGAGSTQPSPAQTPGQRFQIPAQYSGTAPGHVINYGGTNYLTNQDGTMSPYYGAVAR